MRKLIAVKTGNPNSTFRELHENPSYKDLYIMGASINNQRSINFNYQTYPDMQIATAVRISMSIPYYFKTVMIDSIGQRLEKKPTNAFYDVCVDGGITSQLPIELFDVPQENILAFQIVRDDQMQYDALEKIAPYKKLNGVGDYMKAIYNLGKENTQNLKLVNYPDVRIINISDGNVGPRIRKLKPRVVQRLITNGTSAAITFLQKN